jgi:hypothetical protein
LGNFRRIIERKLCSFLQAASHRTKIIILPSRSSRDKFDFFSAALL